MSGAPISELELSSYADGETPDDRQGAIFAWITQTPVEGARVENWRRQNEIIRSAFARWSAETLPADFLTEPHTVTPIEAAPRLATRPTSGEEPIGAPIRQIERIARIRKAQRSRLTTVTAGAFLTGAVAAGAAAFGVGWIPAHRPVGVGAAHHIEATILTDPLANVATRAIEAQRTFARDPNHPVEMAAAQKSRIEEWFASRAGITVDLPNLTSDGLQLLGGRLTPGITGPAAFVVYEDKAGERFGLLLTRAVGQDTPPTRLIATRTIGAVVWLDGGIARALTGPGEPDRLLRIARLIADASPK